MPPTYIDLHHQPTADGMFFQAGLAAFSARKKGGDLSGNNQTFQVKPSNKTIFSTIKEKK